MEGPAVSTVRSRLGRGSWLLLSAAALVLAAICLLVSRAHAQQGVPGCGAGGGPVCVIMVQVDGLEAADVSQTNTPFLWELAHPQDTPPLGQRSGWIWQAPRAPMSAGLGASAASFLIGGYAEQTGVPADDFHLGVEELEASKRVRLGGSDVPNSPIGVVDSNHATGDSVLRLVKKEHGNVATTAAFIGDPDLGPMVAGDAPEFNEVDFGWYPTPGDQESPPMPAHCDVHPSPAIPPAPPGPACASSDAFTLARAFQDLSAGAASNVTLTYIELAELGHVKRAGPNPAGLTAALQATDGALQTFFSGYSQHPETSDQWPNTVVMVSGTSGYEQALPDKRVPDPDAPSPPNVSDPENGQDLANDVLQFSHTSGLGTVQEESFHLIPQGTVATVYLTETAAGSFNDTPGQPSALHQEALAALRTRILSVNNHASCQADNQPPAGPDLCIQEVLYMRPELNGDSAVDTVKEDWRLDHLTVEVNQQTGDATTTPTGRSGELLVVMAPGWAAGKAVPANEDELIDDEAGDDKEVITNPYSASTGGPRNRAVAAIVNGPTSGVGEVRDWADFDPRLDSETGGRYPVAQTAEGTPENPECDATADPVTSDVAVANDTANADPATPEDDANATGHECQAETVDFAVTAAALLKVKTTDDDICGRVLGEAFITPPAPELDTEGAPDAFITQGPVLPPPGQQYPQTDRNVTFEFDTNIRNRGIVECGVPTVVPTTFECSLDGAPYSACSSPLALGPLAKGIHEFCVRAVSGDLRSVPECAKFEVLLFFDFDGLLRDLRAKVTDYEGKSWAEAPRGRRMNRLVISADYGRPLNGVTLTLYKQSSGRVLCGVDVHKPKTTALASGAQASSGAQTSASCPLTGLARFKPFKLDRGHIDLRLRIPKAYKPTHVGVTVQEVKANVLDAATASQCQQSRDFFCFYSKMGAPDGGIVKLGDAYRLHKVKGKKKKKKKRKKRKKR